MSSEPSIKALAVQVSHLRGQVVDLAKALADLRTELADEGNEFQPYAPNWMGLTPEQHAEKVAALAEWVTDVLTPQYLRKPLRACWPHHQPVLWELSTLRAEWFRIYNRTEKRSDLAAGQLFFDRWLPNTMERVVASLKECSTECALVNAPVPIRPARPRPRPA